MSAQAPVIDTHAHWFPDEWVKLIEKEGAKNGAKLGRNEQGHPTFITEKMVQFFSPPFIDLDLRLQAMDKTGVDVHALSLTSPMVYWAPKEFSLALSQCYNDAASRAHQKHPKRFIGTAMLPMQAPDLALKELERASKLPGMRAVYMATNINGVDLDEKSFWPVYAKCEELGWPIMLHPVDTIGADRTKKFYLRNLLGNPYESGVAAAHLIFGGVLDAFPRLEVMLPHAGGTFPVLIGRLDRGAKVRPELKHMKQPPSAYARRFTYDTIGHNDIIIMNLIRLVGADRVMLGSDYCFDMGYERPVDVVQGLTEISGSERDAILGGTAAKLLRL
jgi:aminocarboxymuconate-semialdehyde decarboxylase